MIAEIIGAGLVIVAIGAWMMACGASFKETCVAILIIFGFIGGFLLLITGGTF